MPSIASAKTKAQDLKRIRENQQRSRDRKRAHVEDLEQKVRQLTEKLSRCEKSDATLGISDEQAHRENRARKELLKTLGIDERAQAQFVRAFSHLSEIEAKGWTAEDATGPPIRSRHAEGDTASTERFQTCVHSVGELRTASSDPEIQSPRTQYLGATNNATFGCETAETNHLALVKDNAAGQSDTQLETQPVGNEPVNKPTVFTPCLWNATISGNPRLESMTGCSVGFSMLLANNSRGYTFADLDARLQAAYREDGSVPEGCSILNSVLYDLLREIS